MQTDGSPSTDRPSLASEASSSSPSPSRDDGAPRIIVATLAGELHCFELHVSATKAARSLRCWSSRLPMDSPLLTCVGEPSGPTLLTSPKHATTASSVGSSTSTSRADVASLQTHANSRVVADVPVCFFCAAAAASAMRAESPTNNMSIHINNSSLASSTEARMAPAPGDWPFSSKHWLAITHPHSSSSEGGEVDGAQWFWRSSLHHSPMVLPHRNNNNNNNDGSSEGTWVPLEEMVQRWNQSCCNTHRVVILRKLSEVYAEYSLATGELVFTPEEAEEGLMFVGEDGNKAEPPPHHRSSIVGKRASPDVHERNGGYLALTLTSHIVRVLQPAAMHARKSAAPKYSSKLVEGTIAMELIAPDDEDEDEGIDENIPVNVDGLRSPTSCSVAQEEEDEEEDEDSGSEVDYEAFCRRRSAMLEKQEKARQRAEASAHHRDPNAEVSPSPSSSPPPSHMTCTVDGVVHLHHYDCVSEEWKQSIHYLNVGCILAAYSLFPSSSSSSCAPMAAGTRQPQPIMKAMQVMPTSTNLRSSVEYVLPSSVDANHKKSNQQQQQSVPLVELPTETRRGYLTSSANGLFVLVAEDVSAHADVLSPIASRSSRHLFPSLPQTSLRETSSADVARNGSVAVQSATGWRRSSSAPTPGSDGTSFFDANFHPVAILGKGGSGVALLAKHRLTDVLYAVKVVLARDVESEEEIVKEVRLHAYLEHPHLVRYHACWSETVTPARAHQLALIGLCRKSEVVDDLGRSGHYTHRTHPRSPATTNNSNNNHHTRFSPGTLTCTTSTPSAAVGWGQIDLTRDTNGMLLVGEDSFSSISRSMSEASPISSHRGLFPGASHLFENSESSDDDDDDDDSSTSDDDDGSDDESESPSSLDQRRRRTRSVVGSTVIFLQMEFCQTTLAMYLATRKKIDPIMNCIILQQLLLGLSYLHQRNVLHRDIKPSNVFLDFRCQVHANPSSSFMPGELGDHEDGVSPSAEPYFMGSEADGSRRRGSKSMSSTALTAPLMPKKPSAFTEERPTFSIEAQQTSDELLNRHFEQMLCASQLLRSMVSNRVSLLSPEARDAHSPLMAHRKPSASASKELKTLVAWLHQHLVQLRLGDFGLAKLFHDQKLSVSGVVSHTRANTVGAGSPLYASPEQMRGDVCTPASDLFSVGVMMAEMYIQPTTVSERLVVLREVREGRFPDADLLAQFPELAVVEALTHSDPHARMSLTKVRDALHGHLVMYLEKYFLQV